MTPPKVAGANAGWRRQFRFAVRGFWPGVAAFFVRLL